MSDHIWVRTDRGIGGHGYRISVEFTEDTAVGLSPTEAHDYVDAIYMALAWAEYDAAVFRQLTLKLGMDNTAAAGTLQEIRARRAPLTTAGPLELVPGVSVFTGKAFLVIQVYGEKIGQWSPADARHHASGILDAIAVAPLDDAYHATLTGDVGVTEAVADQVLDDLARYREDY